MLLVVTFALGAGDKVVVAADLGGNGCAVCLYFKAKVVSYLKGWYFPLLCDVSKGIV
jgi:hypothetical protein